MAWREGFAMQSVCRGLAPWLSRAEAFAWRLTCRAADAGWASMPVATRPVQHRSPREWMRFRLARAGFPDPDRLLDALVEHKTCEGGSDALAALLEDAPARTDGGLGWTPGDVDLFAMCRGLDGEWRSDDVAHYTPFVHAAFGFASPAFPTHEAVEEDGSCASERMPECLAIARQRDGYDVLPVWRRTYRLAATPDVEHHHQWPPMHAPLPSECTMGTRAPGDVCHLKFQIVMVYRGGTKGHASLTAFFEANPELPFCNVLFDGRRFRVRDWDSVWTRSATVRGGPAIRADDSREHAARKWHRFLDRVGKYRSRGFRVELVDLDTGPLRTPGGGAHRHLSRRGAEEKRVVRRASMVVPGERPPEFPWAYPKVGIFDAHLGPVRNLDDWRPTYALRQQADAHRAEIERKRDAQPAAVTTWEAGRLWRTPAHGGSAPSTPRATHARHELHRNSYEQHAMLGDRTLRAAMRRVRRMREVD